MTFHPGDHIRIKCNAPGTVWESGVIEYIRGDRAYILYGVSRLGDWCGVRGMCSGEDIADLELIPPKRASRVFEAPEPAYVPVVPMYERGD